MRPSYGLIIMILSALLCGGVFAIFYDPEGYMYLSAVANGNYKQYWELVSWFIFSKWLFIDATVGLIIWWVVNTQRPGTGGEGE